MVSDSSSVSDGASVSDLLKYAVAKAVSGNMVMTDAAIEQIGKALSGGMTVTDAIASVGSMVPLQPVPQWSSDQLKLPTDILTADPVLSASSDADVALIDNRHYIKSLYHLYNMDPTNSIIFSIYGNNNDNGGQPPAFDTSWVPLPNAAAVTLGTKTPIALTLTDRWRWILIRAHVSGGTPTLAINISAHKH